MNNNSKIQLPEFIEPILKKERIVFQTLANNFNTKNYYLSKAIFTIATLLIIIFAFQEKLNNVFKLLLEYKFNLIATFTELSNFELLLITSTLILIALAIFSFFKLLQPKELGPWFIGTDNFLLITNNKKSIPVSWHYLSTDIIVKKNKQNGTIILRYDRKDYANPIVNSILKNNNKYQIPIKGIKNAEQIAGLILAKIKNN